MLQRLDEEFLAAAVADSSVVARLRSLVGDRVCWHPPTRPVRRRYTDEELLRHVSDWVGAYGSSAAGYRAAAQTRPGWPSLTTITGRFGSWSHALQAAGQGPRR